METMSSRTPRAARWTAAMTALFIALAPVEAAAQQGALLAPPAGAGVIVILPDSLEPRPRTLSELLRDYVPSASVQRPTGALGASAVVSLRDASVIRGDDPLVVVDGIRQVSYRAAFEPFDRRPPSILDDIPLDDVERIEILAGPAAAASYGYDGQRGAIVITTRSPGAGRPVIRASITASTADAHADYTRNLSRVTATGTSCPYFAEASGNCTATGTSRYTPLLDHGPFRSGQQGSAHLGATGGLGRLGYSAALGFGRGIGTLDANAADRTSASLRLGMPLSGIVHIELASFATERGISDGRAALFQRGVGGGPLDCSRATPCGADSTSNGYRFASFAYLNGRGPHRRIGHLSEALAIDVAPRSNLSLRTSATADMLRDKSSLLDSITYSLGTSYRQICANERNWRVGGSQEARLTTHVGAAIATTSLSVRFDAERSRDEIVTISRACAPPSYGNSIAGASSGSFLRRDRVATSFDQRFAWGDRAALGLGAMRTTTKWWKDYASLAPVIDPHADAMYQLVPAASPLGMLTSLRLRTAYGRTSGHDARPFSAPSDIGPFPLTPLPVAPFPIPRFQPDRSTELEAGFDAAFSPASTRLSVTAFRRRETIRGLTWIIRRSGDVNGAVTRRVAGGEIVAETTPIRLAGARLHLRGQLSLTHDRVSGWPITELLAVAAPGALPRRHQWRIMGGMAHARLPLDRRQR